MICGVCKYTDGLVYTSNPPKVCCKLTKDFHYASDECTCEEARMLEEKKSNFNTDLTNFNEALADRNYLSISDTDKSVQTQEIKVLPSLTDFKDLDEYQALISEVSTIGVPCLICGETVSTDFWHHGPRVCQDCKNAIQFIKEKFKGEINA
jgi:hypothetical protein